MNKPRFYHHRWDKSEKHYKIRRDNCFSDLLIKREGLPTLPKSLLEIAHDEYTQQGHDQSFETIEQRGGFSALEVITLLADRVERLNEVISNLLSHNR